MDPVARAREIAARLAAQAIPGGGVLGKRSSRWEGDVDGGVRPAPGMGEKKRKKVYIPVDKYPDINFMGLLIGPRGSNQKRMEDESGARILIRGKGSSKDPTGDPDENEELHVLITADTDESVAKAQSAVEDILFNPQQAMKLKQEQLRKVAELNGTLNENYGGPKSDGQSGAQHYGPGGDNQTSYDMKVPRDLVGYIIGRGGETIRDLQMKSGAHIQIVREEEGAPQTPDRFVNITGNQESLELAQKLIQNLLDERQQNQTGGGGFRERDDRDRMARYGGINPDGTDSVELLVPNERVGLIIGRGGCTIKAIQQRTGTSVTIPQTPDPNHPEMRLITIRGTMEAKEAAKFEIQSMISEDPSQRHGYGMTAGQTIYMQVPNDRVGVIIGKRGETIKGIQDRHAVRIQIPQVADPGSNPPVRTISIQGPAQNLTGAKEEVDTVILQGAGSHGYGGGGDRYGGGNNYNGGAGGYDQQQQYNYGAQGQQDQYAGYYQQQGQYYQQDSSTSATAAATATAAPGSEQQQTSAAADPNDPNAYWNGYYEYAAYYGVDAANEAWGVTGAAAQASAEMYQQYQQQAAAAAGDATTAPPGTSADASTTNAVPGDDSVVKQDPSDAAAPSTSTSDAPADSSGSSALVSASSQDHFGA
ncbi:Splicing factor 1 [Phytophthora boehmeriae]|uniref:Splicing factor 1 n=1 Tax=Phytophthora boehmeriae TaxID=109152 RepID=A0A8T1WXU2_9STRA|nr:Splicing factor 1 [Phytophthora boehmeriae]